MQFKEIIADYSNTIVHNSHTHFVKKIRKLLTVKAGCIPLPQKCKGERLIFWHPFQENDENHRKLVKRVGPNPRVNQVPCDAIA